MTGLDKLREALLDVLPNVSHGHGYKLDPPYLIWQENGFKDLCGNNVILFQIAKGQVGLYYNGEDPNLVSKVHRALRSVGACSMTDNHYVQELGLNEALWNFEVIC